MDRSRFKDRLSEFCESEAGHIVSNTDSSDDLKAWRDDLEEVAETWGLDIGDTLQRLDEEAEERQAREPYDGDEPYEAPARRMPTPTDSDEEINRLFRSLRRSGE